MADYTIGMFAGVINPYMYGSSRNTYYLAKALEEKGCQVTVFCTDDLYNRGVDLNKIYVPASRWRFFPNIVPESFKMAKKAKEMENEFDLFHSNCCYGFPYVHNGNRPFVLHLREIALKSLNTIIAADFLKALSQHGIPYLMVKWLMESYTTKKSDLVFCNSEETAKGAYNVLGVAPSKIKVIYNGVDTRFFLKGDGEVVRERYNLEDKRVLLCVTRLDLYKGIDRLLSAMKIIAKKQGDIVLLLVGGGELENKIRDTIIKERLTKSVILTGHVTEKSLADFYVVADLFVYPTSPGTTLLEAMAALKPFIVYYNSNDIPSGVPIEKIIDKKIGKVIKDKNISVFAKEIINYLDDNKWLSQQGEKGFQYVREELNWSKISDEVIKYYGQII